MGRKVTLGPVNRVEGDLEVQLTLAEHKVASAQVQSTLYRGFENLLTGKTAMDALAITPRICGICSVSQSVAAARAIADFANIPMAANGERVTNILLATEVVTDLLTHFYLFFMPDFTHPGYQKEAWAEQVAKRFTSVKGERHGIMLKARAEFLHIMGILAGKWPHSMVFQPGGVSKVVSMSEQIKLLGIVSNFKQFLEAVMFGDTLENIARLDSEQALSHWHQENQANQGDFSLFLALSQALSLQGRGSSQNNFLSFPAYPSAVGHLYPGGVAIKGNFAPLNTALIDEQLDYSKLYGSHAHPSSGLTQPDTSKEGAYTWSKAPRYDGHVMETGAIARQYIAREPLAVSLVSSSGSNIHNRIVLRLVEMAKLVLQIEQWLTEIKPNDSFCHHQSLPREGQGMGLSEAARGALGHWIRVENGKIANYQLVAPTSWNFSPRDNQGHPGALEYALAGIDYQSERDKQMLQHIIRSFDPCMLCTVH